METISGFPGSQVRTVREREITELGWAIEEVGHSSPLLAYVDQEEMQEPEEWEPEERDWPLDPMILHGLVYP